MAAAQANAQLKAVVALLLQCAYGRAIYNLTGRTPPRQARIEVALKESAFNPLSPQQYLQNRDETLYVGFEQRISFQVLNLCLCLAGRACESFTLELGSIGLCRVFLPAKANSSSCQISFDGPTRLGALNRSLLHNDF